MSERVLGIDYGSVRIGIAVSDETNHIAFGKEAIPNDKLLLQNLLCLINNYSISKIVLGYPLTLKGTKSAFTFEVEHFEEKLKSFLHDNKISSKIIRWDERLTSKIANKSLIDSGMKKNKKKDKSSTDIVSAALILQSYLDSNAFNRTK